MSEASDPFGERVRTPHRQVLHVLGAEVLVTTNSRELLGLLDHAFARLPRHRLRARTVRLQLRLLLTSGRAIRGREPPGMRLHSGPGVLMGMLDADNFAVVSPDTRSAFVSASRAMLKFPYHLRYELIEFALLTLAARAQDLVPLHAACVALRGHGLLLDGATGSGKSTLSAACIAAGFELLAEDGVFVDPLTLRATGCATFLHLRADSLRFVRDAQLRDAFREAPGIRRRSGARKFELDARAARLRLAAQPPRLAALIVLSTAPARGRPLLVPLSRVLLKRIVRRHQPYAAGQSQWRDFVDRLATLPAYRLLRPEHPDEAVQALRELLEARSR